MEWQSLLDRWRAGAKAEQSLGAHGINVSYTTQDPYSSFTRFLRCDLHAPAGVNWGYHCDAEMDELLGERLARIHAGGTQRVAREGAYPRGGQRPLPLGGP